MLDHLRVVTGSRVSGNTSLKFMNEAWKIIDNLLHVGVITKAQHGANVTKHFQ